MSLDLPSDLPPAFLAPPAAPPSATAPVVADPAFDPVAVANALIAAMSPGPITAAPPIPPLINRIGIAVAQKALTMAATALAAYGVIAPTKEATVVSLGLSSAAWAASFTWTLWHEFMARQTQIAATNALPPAIVAKP